MPTATFPEIEVKPDRRPDMGGRGFGGSGRDDGSERPSRRAIPAESYRLGVYFALGAILMLFVGFVSAYIYRQGLSFDWVPLRAPRVLWFDTAILLISSFTFELARRSLQEDDLSAFERWLGATTMLGVVFLGGQYAAWRQLQAQGIYLGTNPHSSFFYLLTGAHGLHLLGGVLVLGYVMYGALHQRYSPKKAIAVDCSAIYWHFMDGLWLFLFVLLFLWR